MEREGRGGGIKIMVDVLGGGAVEDEGRGDRLVFSMVLLSLLITASFEVSQTFLSLFLPRMTRGKILLNFTHAK